MSTSELGALEQAPREPPWDEKLLLLHDALARHDLSYAFGGAVALNYHREPRATLDIDINIFVSAAAQSSVLTALAEVFAPPDRDRLRADLSRDGQARTIWGDTYIDLFLSNTDFHASMEARVQRQPFDGREIPVLSIEDLLVCKVLFDRPKDWLDLEAVVATRARTLDRGYIASWLARFLEPDDARLLRAAATMNARSAQT